jgi:tRNA pseudouridine38-40 synthase
MARYQVTLAYDGTDFSGFQRQASGRKVRTVQASVEEALRRIGWQSYSILAAGRTDAGVHATGQVIAFDLMWKHSELDLLAALNANLPADVAARKVTTVSPDFHPRFDALSRHYRYRIFCQPFRDPLRERYAWRVWPGMDIKRLRESSSLLVGEHDFGAFGSSFHKLGTTVRKVLMAEWRSREDELTFDIIANSFLFRMVRRLVSFQVSIAQTNIDVSSISERLRAGSNDVVQGIAPANGLSLVEVTYLDQDATKDIGKK